MQLDRPTLSGRHLIRTFGVGETEVRALADVSLDLYTAEIALLKGPSGSGKTTLLGVLSGLLRPTSGQVEALGESLWTMTERQREDFRLRHCGFIFQEHNLLMALTAQQQLEMVLRWGVGVSAREARNRAREMLELLGLARKGQLRSLELSGGEKQRVAIGRALIKDPTFCFADEPTSCLDWSNGECVVELLRNAAHDHHKTVLIASHDERVEQYADCVFCMEDGKLLNAPLSNQPDNSNRFIEATVRHDPSVQREDYDAGDRKKDRPNNVI